MKDVAKILTVLFLLAGFWVSTAHAATGGYGGDEVFFNLSARAKTGKVQLVWTHQPGIIRYDVFRSSEASPSSFEKIGETTSTYSTYLDQTVTNEVTYLYRLTAVYPDITLHSEVVSGRPPATRDVRNGNPVIYSVAATQGTATYLYEYKVKATDPNADLLSYSLAVSPGGMSIDSSGGMVSWTPSGPGSFPVRVEVNDGKGGTAAQEFTILVELPPNEAPTADAGPDQDVFLMETVQLDGSSSSDPDWNTLTYQWSLVSVPEGSNASLSDSAAVNPTFVADLPGTYVLQLVVRDDWVESAPDTVTIVSRYRPPSAAMSANPGTVIVGGVATLSWNTSHAESCSIEPGIGNVGLSGSIAVSPAQTTTYILTASGPGGTESILATVIVLPVMSLQISSPLPGEWVSGPSVMVKGTVTNASGMETGITVNGVVAELHGNDFAANHVPLVEGENIIAVNALDTEGHTSAATFSIQAETNVDTITVSALSTCGVAPFETRVAISENGRFSNASLHASGAGPVEVIKNEDGDYTVRTDSEGMVWLTAQAVDLQGNVHRDAIAVQVRDRVTLDALLKSKWNAMKGALANQNISEALRYFAKDMRGLYNDIYTTLYDDLPAIAQNMRDIQLVDMDDGMARYRVLKEEVYGQQRFDVSYYIHFVVDADGLWRIYRY